MRQMKWLTPFILIFAIVFILSACGTLPEKPTGLDDTENEEAIEEGKAEVMNEDNLVASDTEMDLSEKEDNKKNKKDPKPKKDDEEPGSESEQEKKLSGDNSEQKSSDSSEKKSENKTETKDKASTTDKSEGKSEQKDKSTTTQKSESKKEQKSKSSTDKKSTSKENKKSESKKKDNPTKKEDKSKDKEDESKDKEEPSDDSNSSKEEVAEPEAPKDPKSTIVHSIVISSNEVPLPATKLEIEEGDTILDALIAITMEHEVQMDYRGGQGATAYVQGMGNVYEFDRGPGSGWMFSVNGIFPNRGAGVIPLQDGDIVEWLYTTNLGEDLNADLKPFR